VIDSGFDGWRSWFTMELLPGRSLEAELAERGALPWPEVAALGRDVASTLVYLHERRILHRDVKPANVVLAPGRHSHLVDFGLARRSEDLGLTGAHELVATPAFLAPEVVASAFFSPASDAYALGVTLWTALTGFHPQALQSPGLDEVAARAPGPLCKLIDRSLSEDPRQRPAAVEAEEILAELVRQRG
jgi:serine/threonine protein kinase